MLAAGSGHAEAPVEPAQQVTKDGLVTRKVLRAGQGECPPLHARCLGAPPVLQLRPWHARRTSHRWPLRSALHLQAGRHLGGAGGHAGRVCFGAALQGRGRPRCVAGNPESAQLTCWTAAGWQKLCLHCRGMQSVVCSAAAPCSDCWYSRAGLPWGDTSTGAGAQVLVAAAPSLVCADRRKRAGRRPQPRGAGHARG